MTLTMADLQPRVDRGAAWLDTNKPGWFNQIDLEALDLSDCSQCALGQCFGHFGNGLLVMFPEYERDSFRDNVFGSPMIDWASEHGFERVPGVDMEESYGLLRECWITAILARRFAEHDATVVETPAPVTVG